jgi:carboxypeptidase family protein/TonB-dependent receptor-like protein
MSPLIKVLVLSLLGLVIFGGTEDQILAQENVGKIVGTIRDASGSVVPDAQVTAQHLASGKKWETVTSKTGDFTFPALQIGEYSLRTTATGFKTAERPSVRIFSGVTLTVNFELVVGEITESVQVTAQAIGVEATTNSVGNTLESEMVAQLPLVMSGGIRSALSFLSTQSTVTSDQVIAGVPVGQTAYTVDGVAGTSAPNSPLGDSFSPSPEMVSEIRLTTDQASAEYGTSYGNGLTVVTKSGTNQLHGSVYHYIRNEKLDARNWFASSRNPQRQNEWGLVIGGPVMIPKVYDGKNKTFFFFSYGGFRFRTAAGGATASVPTALMRQGNFSELFGPQLGTDALGRPILTGQIYDPLTTRPDGSGGYIRDPFPGNIIPSARFSTVSQNFQKGYPLPNRPGTALNWVGSRSPDFDDYDRFSIKVDHHITDRQTLSFNWENSWHDIGTGGIFDPTISDATRIYWYPFRVRVNYYYGIRTNLLFNFRAGSAVMGDTTVGRKGLPSSTYGATAGLKGVYDPDTPLTSIQGMTGFGHTFTGDGLTIPQQTLPVNADVTWTKGRHNIKMGASELFGMTSQDWDTCTAACWNFSARVTGQPGVVQTGSGYASFLMGEVDSAGLSTNKSSRVTSHTLGFYGQDSWRVTPKLTLNYGLRWDIFLPMKEQYQKFSSFDPRIPNPAAGGRLGALTFWGEGPGRNGRSGLWNTKYDGFYPNLGFAYAFNSKTVLRASYGLTSIGYFGVMTAGLRAPIYGWYGSYSAVSLDNGLTPALNWDKGFPIEKMPPIPRIDPSVFNGSSLNYVEPTNARPGRVQNINFGLEREVWGNTVIRANYVGKLAHGVPTENLIQWNQFDPSYLSLGNLLLANINSPPAQAAGIPLPYPGFNGTVAQALRPYPQYQSLNEFLSPAGFSTYHGIELTAQKRTSHGLTFLVSYTASKYLTNAGSFSGQGSDSQPITIQTSTQRKQAKGLYFPADQPQSLAVSYVYELPFGPGKPLANSQSAVVKQLVGGWRVAGIHQYRSGAPVRISTLQSLPVGYGPAWANRVPDVPIGTGLGCGDIDPNDPARNKALNVNAFANPAPFTLGNTLTLPSTRSCGTLNENFSIQKLFPIKEAVRIDFGADFSNLLNRHQWTGLSTNIGVPAAFGRYSGATAPRSIQFHLKVEF